MHEPSRFEFRQRVLEVLCNSGRNGVSPPRGPDHETQGTCAMADHSVITPELCRQLLRYEPETGKLFWLPRCAELSASAGSASRFNILFAGKEAFTTVQGQGYLCSAIYHASYRAHRVAWAIHFGQWPQFEIDHINGDRQNNRIANLRAATATENNRNLAKPKNNTSGAVGVTWCPRSGKWQARIVVSNVAKSLGYHNSFEDALAARQSAEIAYGFSEGHGQRLAWSKPI